MTVAKFVNQDTLRGLGWQEFLLRAHEANCLPGTSATDMCVFQLSCFWLCSCSLLCEELKHL